jgi:molybdenum cofactor guanylyltransferase
MSSLGYAKVMTFSGAVLAGGKSQRFGQNKALYPYRNKPLIHWVLESLNQASERFVIAHQDLGLRVPVYPDLKTGFDSLSGIHSALSHANYDWVAIAACDLPFLNQAYWQYLLSYCDNRYCNDVQMVISQNQTGFLEPLAALYHRSILPQIEAQMASQDLTLHHLTQHTRTHRVPWAELQRHFSPPLFLNANQKSNLPEVE